MSRPDASVTRAYKKAIIGARPNSPEECVSFFGRYMEDKGIKPDTPEYVSCKEITAHLQLSLEDRIGMGLPPWG